MSAGSGSIARAAHLARAHAVLANPDRLRIVLLLDERGPTRTTEIAGTLGLHVANVSQKLGVLRRAGFVARDARDGSYGIADHPLWRAVRGLQLQSVGGPAS